jgi:predicted nucleotide-binding protein
MNLEDEIKEAQKLAKKVPTEEFKHSLGTSPSIEKLTILIQNLSTRVTSPSVRRLIEDKLNAPLPTGLTAIKAYYYYRSRWAALNTVLEIAIRGIDDKSLRPADQGLDSDRKSADPLKVFVVHGRNQKARDGMFEFLRVIGLNPIEWSEALNLTDTANPFIGEILDKAFQNAQAVVVLLTPDDLAHLKETYVKPNDPPHEKEPTGQPRPNVLFEAGMAFGSHPDRTILVEIGNCRPFSDIAGRFVIRWDNSSMRRQDLANALKRAGCEVNLDGTDWHTAGEIEIKPD